MAKPRPSKKSPKLKMSLRLGGRLLGNDFAYLSIAIAARAGHFELQIRAFEHAAVLRGDRAIAHLLRGFEGDVVAVDFAIGDRRFHVRAIATRTADVANQLTAF